MSIPTGNPPASVSRRQKSRQRLNITLHIPTSMQDVRENQFLQALARTTMDFCHDSTLHGIKHIVMDIQDLGSSYSRQKRINKLVSLIIWSSTTVMGAVFAIVLMGLVWDRFQTTPTITIVETNNCPFWNFHFPSLCRGRLSFVHNLMLKSHFFQSGSIEKGLKKESIVKFLENLAKLITPEYIDALYLKNYQYLEEMGSQGKSLDKYPRNRTS